MRQLERARGAISRAYARARLRRIFALMGNRSGIEWTDITWNPVTGCTQVSSGCDNCYALTLAHRLLHEHYTKREPQRDTPANRRDPFAVRLWPERLDEPLHWRGSQRVFVNSMGD